MIPGRTPRTAHYTVEELRANARGHYVNGNDERSNQLNLLADQIQALETERATLRTTIEAAQVFYENELFICCGDTTPQQEIDVIKSTGIGLCAHLLTTMEKPDDQPQRNV